MARLRHIAVCVSDLDKAAEFYAKVFEFKKIGREDLDIGSAIYMSDGVINMALLNFKGKGGSAASDIKEGQTFIGAHHFGIQVDDLAETQKRIEAAGGKFFFDLGDERHGNFERKFKDPDGVIFDISKSGGRAPTGIRRSRSSPQSFRRARHQRVYARLRRATASEPGIQSQGGNRLP